MIMTQEAALLKAKDEFRKIEEALCQATIQGTRIDGVEENLWDQMLGLGRLLLTSFVAGQGTGPPVFIVLIPKSALPASEKQRACS